MIGGGDFKYKAIQGEEAHKAFVNAAFPYQKIVYSVAVLIAIEGKWKKKDTQKKNNLNLKTPPQANIIAPLIFVNGKMCC